MARLARIVIANMPHHVTQRGNGRQFLLASDLERSVYLKLLRRYVNLYRVSLLGYCVMSNHVHLVLVPHDDEALAQALKQAHGRYATYWNGAQGSSGHVWQGRFYSCPLDHDHLWIALRYAELNPVRAGLVARAEAWPWSSAKVHCDPQQEDSSLEMTTWKQRWSAESWMEYLQAQGTDGELAALRQCTHTGRPLGGPGFVQSLEAATARQLAAGKGGRPRKGHLAEQRAQIELGLGE